ncbi:UDP-glucose 4-epimerase GalE [Sporosarcina sp. BI001-red]|uniref:UDP-glucose 4-epimerase GalE n=1 Tax=Sporosarcina sp. BI001-red TaxID=2282866 RepID=UPI000E25F79C|nr:UDP-glucose 4-epimerase GalE [Sporosarcina sp. BI001-red]REB10099.1 UDP-glucose 4-epimerase GalE [Sporosarcina sp. BI001-red]
MSVLVLGGAGYIGSHAVHQLIDQQTKVIVIDNLQTGHQDAIHPQAVFYEGDIKDITFMRHVFRNESIDAVFHFAANSLVGESVEKPLEYFDNNVYGTQVLLQVMKEFDLKKIVFSSSAATYGEPEDVPITEDMSTNPSSPYGETKLMMEKIMKWCDIAYGIRYVALRYFNVAGARRSGIIGEDHQPETHLVPIILQAALGQRDHITIFGDNYDTADGTCIRDYIHVEDLIEAHILALDHLNKGGRSETFNLGSNQGFSVKEMIEAAHTVTGKEISVKTGERRAGDPSILIASSKKATALLGWKPTRTSIETIIQDAWNWHANHPNGYLKDVTPK